MMKRDCDEPWAIYIHNEIDTGSQQLRTWKFLVMIILEQQWGCMQIDRSVA